MQHVDQSPPNDVKKHLNISKEQVDGFAGKKTTSQIIDALLSEVSEINFKQYLQLPEHVLIRQKHYIVAIVKRLLEISKENRWNLAKVYSYIYMFNGCYWQKLEHEEVKSLLGKAAIKMGVPEYDATHFDFKEKLFKQFLTDGYFVPPIPKPDSILINLLNGTYEFLHSGHKLRNFEPSDFLTNQLPFEYNPDAKCPMFDQFLLKVLPDESCRKVLQEFSGYIFTNLNLEKVLILTGSGSNGKSVFFNVLCALVGKANLLNYPLGMFSSEYNRAKLTDKLLNYSSEKGADLDPDTLKLLASREPMQAREPYGRSFTLYPKTKFIINANELARLTELTEAFFRRQLIIHFEVTIKDDEKDIHLADKIIATELPGVFNWVLEGLKRLLLQQFFTPSEKIDAAIAEYKKQSDSVALFVDEKALISSSNKKEPLADLYKSYKDFCHEDGYKAVSKNKFSTRLENKGFERTRLTGGGAGFLIETDYSRE